MDQTEINTTRRCSTENICAVFILLYNNNPERWLRSSTNQGQFAYTDLSKMTKI